MSVQTPAKTPEPTFLGPILCQRCKAVVRWVRRDGGLVLVNGRGRRVHVCQR